MATWARSNEAGEILEIRTFAENEQEPVDIPHKDVIWRPVVVKREQHNPETEDLCVNYECGGNVVRERHYPVGKDIEVLRAAVLTTLRANYHSKILDAMPDMEKVTGICRERDEAYVMAEEESDYLTLRRMTHAEG